MIRPVAAHILRAALVSSVLLLAGAALATPAHAQRVRPWAPASSDSLTRWANQAKAAFREARGDSATGQAYRAYDMVLHMGQRLLASLGRDNLIQAPAVEAVLDSLGLDTSVTVDPTLPTFVLLMVRNPYRLTAHAVGYLLWYRGSELRMQGVVFRGGFDPMMRVWWSGDPSAPYHCAVVDRVRNEANLRRFTLLTLTPAGTVWNAVQYEGNGPDLSNTRDASWIDPNHDGRPELVTFGAAPPDSMFVLCSGCPERSIERIFVQRGGLFDLEDNRLVPSPYATFGLFLHLLREGNRMAAARLAIDPTAVDRATRSGWNARSAAGSWAVEYAEPNQPWPRWLAVRHLAAKDKPLYIVRFAQRDLRWVILEWQAVAPATRGRDSTTTAPAQKGSGPR